jgi:hypothetical protein
MLLILLNRKIWHCISKTSRIRILKANSHVPYRAPAMPCRANSHMPFYELAVLRQWRVFRESPRVYGKIRTANRETPHGSRKKPNLRRSPTGRKEMAGINSHTPSRAHAVPLPCCAVALGRHLQSDMVGARHGMCELALNQSFEVRNVSVDVSSEWTATGWLFRCF